MTKTVSKYIVTPDHLWSLHESRSGHVLYEGPGGLYVGLSHAADASGEYRDIITREDLIERVRSHPSKVSGVANLYDMRRIAKEMNGAIGSATPSESATPEQPIRTNTHVAVIAGSQPPSMEVIANGPQELCEKQLEAWIANHPLDLFFEGQILKVESVIERKPLPPRQALSALLRQITGVKDSDVVDDHVTVITGALKKLEKIEAAWADDHLSKVAKIILNEE